MSTPDKVWWRRGEARAALGVSEEVFTKLVSTGVLTPKYFPGGTRAFFERTQVEGVQPKAKTDGRSTRKCVKWSCENAGLVFLKRGESHQTGNGFFTIHIDGWYCPKCGGSYGGA